MTKKSERQSIKAENVAGGAGYILKEELIKGEQLGAYCKMFNEVTLKPGCEIGYHEHHGETETYYLTKGAGIYNDNGKEYPRQRRCIAHVVVGKALLVDIVHDGAGGAERPALRHYENGFKHVERLDHQQDGYHERCIGEHRHRNADKFLPSCGAVHIRGFVQCLRDGLQPGKEHQHIITAHLPHAHDNERGLAPGRVAQPQRHIIQADGSENVVQDAHVRVEDPQPHHAHRDGGRDAGQEQRYTVALCQPARLFVDEDGQQQRHHQHNGHQRNDKIERIAEIRVKVLVVRERLDVVLQAQPVRLAEQVVIGEG